MSVVRIINLKSKNDVYIKMIPSNDRGEFLPIRQVNIMSLHRGCWIGCYARAVHGYCDSVDVGGKSELEE